MKNIFLSLFFAITYLPGIQAQDSCSKYYPMKEGTTFQITVYDKKNKVGSILNYEVIEAGKNTAEFNINITDEEGTSVANSQYGIQCENDGISIDFRSLMGANFLQQYKDTEMEMTGTNLDLPNTLSPGLELPDASMEASFKTGPVKMKMRIDMINRKVVGNESITTPAGTFNCVVISYTTEFKMGLKRSGLSKQWLAESIGLVKSEEYNKKGKLVSSSLLTAFHL